MSEQESIEQRAFAFIVDKGDDGILQRDLRRELDTDSRVISRIVLRLEARKLITRERELADGHWTYRIVSNIDPVQIDSIIGVPCFACEDIEKCEVGMGISAADCDKLTQWLRSSSRD